MGFIGVVRVLAIVAGLIFIVALLQFLSAIHPWRFYSSNTPDKYGLEYQNISFKTSDKIEIRGWLIQSEQAKATVIVGHGYPFDKGNILPLVKFLYPNHNLLLYDHRYFGESSGLITSAGLKETKDVEAAVKFIKKRFGKKHIALYGFSMSAAAMLMAKVNVSAIIADSPYADLEKMIQHIYAAFGPLKFPFVFTTNILASIFLGAHPKQVSPAARIKQSNIPVLLIHGDKDTQIPVENAYIINESAKNVELWIVKGSDHGQAHFQKKTEYERRVNNFLRKHMSKK